MTATGGVHRILRRDPRQLARFLIIAGLLAIPFSTKNSRQGSITTNFIIGICLGFFYYVLHAISLSFAILKNVLSISNIKSFATI
jgi:lipopolysaccharide export LptBFGC system permease protein LptF